MSSQDLLSLQQKTTSPAPQPQPLQPQQQQPTGPKDATSPAPQPQPQAQQEPSSQGNPKAGPGKRQHSKMLPVKPLPPPPPKGKKKAEEVEVAEAEDKEGEANPAPAPAPVTAPVTPGGVFEVPVEFDSPTSVPPGDLVDNIQQRLAAPAFCDIAVAVKVRGQAGGCATVLALVEHEGECAVFVLTLIGSALVLTETIPLVPGVVERTSRNTIQDEAQQQQQQQQQQQHGTGAATAAPSATPVPPPPPPPTTTPAFIEFRRHGKPSVTFEAADPTSPTSSLTISLFEQIIPAKAASSAPTALTLLSGSPHGWLKNYPKRHIDESLFATKVDIIPVKVFFGTWNVNGQKPPASLGLWLVEEGSYPDIYCLGFQELDLSASALVRKDTPKAEPWENLIQLTLEEEVGDYVKLCSKQLAGILLCVFVRRGLADRITDVQTDLMPVGLLGKMGNKGGVAIRFNINDTSFCVVNTHLNAGIGNVERRNQDYHDIAGALSFPAAPASGRAPRLSIWDHQFLFWIGDLNYRIDASNEDVRARVRRGDIPALLADDQLYAQMRARTAFDEFMEAPITFAPTYKYDKNSTEYDTRQQPRIPAYCDRVLWRIHEGETLTTLSYARHELLSSDHRPVSATFILSTQSGAEAARQSLLQGVGGGGSSSGGCISSSNSSGGGCGFGNDAGDDSFSAEDFLAPGTPAISSVSGTATTTSAATASPSFSATSPNLANMASLSPPFTPASGASLAGSGSGGHGGVASGPPTVAVSANEIGFGTLGYEETRERRLLVTNTGKRPARWSFVKRPGRSEVCQAWLGIAPASGILAPGAQEAVALRATVDSTSAKLLCTIAPDSQLLKDVLVLHVEGGSDHFIALNGCYARSCFGMTPDQLTHYPGPVRTTPPDKDRRLWIPKELWCIADHILTSCMDAPDLFSAAADDSRIPLVRDALDTGQPLALLDLAPRDVSNALLAFLRALGEPFIPPSLVLPLIRAPSYAGCKELIARVLPDTSYASLYYTLAFLRELLRHGDKNHLTPERLAVLFSPVLLRLPPHLEKDPAVKKDADFVLYRFLRLEDSLEAGKAEN